MIDLHPFIPILKIVMSVVITIIIATYNRKHKHTYKQWVLHKQPYSSYDILRSSCSVCGYVTQERLNN